MPRKKSFFGLTVLLAIILAIPFVTATPAAAQLATPHTFGPNESENGEYPAANLILSASGDFYGTTAYGGTGACSNAGILGCGTVFELKPTASGSWTEKVIHSFNDNGTGVDYLSAGLVIDAAGDLFGTRELGGAYNYGTMFELKPKGSEGWTAEVVHNFNDNGKDGYEPHSGLIIDTSGNLYGTTIYGGAYGSGTIFELKPKAGGGWTEKVVHSFNNNGADGTYPYAGLIFDDSGNLYGTTFNGGAYNSGAVFELKFKTGVGWSEKVLHSFNNNGTDGAYPYAGLIIDASGNRYGTTIDGGFSPGGTVFELSHASGGGWTESLLWNFCGCGVEGDLPVSAVVFGPSGYLFGTSYEGGLYNAGTVFEIFDLNSGAPPETRLSGN